MIELIVYNYLKSVLTVPVCVERQEGMEMYVYLEKTSGSVKNGIKSCTLAVQSYANSFQESLELNEQVKKAMENIITLDDISSCRLSNDYKYDDVVRKKHRYQALFNITY